VSSLLFAAWVGGFIVEIIVEKMGRAISVKAHLRTQETTPGNALCCESTILAGTGTVFREHKRLADVPSDVHDPPGSSKVDGSGDPMGQTTDEYVFLYLL